MPESSLINTVNMGSKEMRYLHFGNEDGEKLVVLPGVSLKSVLGAAEAIVALYGPLAEKFDIYLFDHVTEEPEGYDIAAMAEDTISAFDELGLEKVNMIGVSMGGMVTQMIAVKAPEKVAALVLCSTAMDTAHADKAIFENWKNLAKQKKADELMAAFGENVYTKAFYEQFKDAIIASGEGTTDLDFSNFLISVDAVTGFDVKNELKNVSCPAFVIGAGEDKIFGIQSAHDLAEALNCECYVYEGYGHAAYDEAPDYLEHIRDFLGRK
ncbi:MAG: alpha/beta hydrolase [Clostridia bacterium]|nr:alpha/beta hydrolase [Clostridia bacterium]